MFQKNITVKARRVKVNDWNSVVEVKYFKVTSYYWFGILVYRSWEQC